MSIKYNNSISCIEKATVIPNNVAVSSSSFSSKTFQKPHLAKAPSWHKIFEALIYILAMSSIASIILIFVFITREALPLFLSEEIRSEVTMRTLWLGKHWAGYDQIMYIWQPVSDIPKYNLWPLIVGTMKVTLITMAISTPLGVASALFVSQFASRSIREIIKPTIEIFAGIPSVVLGFFALIVLATITQDTFGLESRLNAIVAGVALSFAVIPLVFTISEEAFGSVPKSYVEASTALGARKFQTIIRVIIPAASPGIAAAMALGFGRAVGETMIILMASGNAAILSVSFSESVRTLATTVAAELAEVVFGGAHYTVLFYIGVLLFIITFVINSVGCFAIDRLRVKLGEIK